MHGVKKSGAVRRHFTQNRRKQRAARRKPVPRRRRRLCPSGDEHRYALMAGPRARRLESDPLAEKGSHSDV